MKPLKSQDEDYFYMGYGELIDSMEWEILARSSIGDYQGSYLYLFQDNGLLGILTFGYGSCSGCDALQACESVAEATALRDRMASSVIWRTPLEMLEYINTKDWDGEWYRYYREDDSCQAPAEIRVAVEKAAGVAPAEPVLAAPVPVEPMGMVESMIHEATQGEKDKLEKKLTVLAESWKDRADSKSLKWSSHQETLYTCARELLAILREE